MMEWHEQSVVSCEDAFSEAQRWIEAVTKKTFGSNNFRSALENGVLLCDLVNRIKPGIIKRVNRLSTPIAGLDNVNVFLRACGKLGLKEAQLFHPGDLQDLSSRVTIKRQETSRRLKNVLISLYWLGRTAQNDPFYHGPYLNLKAFEGLLGIALSKALKDSVSQRSGSSSVRDSGFGDGWYCEREDLFYVRGGGRQPRRENSLDSLDSEGSRPPSISSDTTLKGGSEGCYSDAEGDSLFKMADNKDPLLYRRSLVLTPKTATQFNQFLPTKDKSSGYVPAPLRKKRAERQEDNRRSWVGPQFTEDDGTFTSETRPSADLQGNGLPQGAPPVAHPQRAYQYESGSDSDAERPDPDLVLDDLASRRFHSPSPAPPTNFAVPIGLPEGGVGVSGGRDGGEGGGGGTWPRVSASSGTPPRQTSTFLSSSSSALCAPRHASVRVDHGRPASADSLLRQLWDDSEDEDDEDGYADPVQDDLYARKVGLSPQPITSAPYNKFLPKFWTPEEDIHIQKIKLGSQRRPWYRKMQGFSTKKSGSSSDDSDCDVSPWLSSAPPPSAAGPSLPHPHAPQGSAILAGQSPHTHPHSAPQQTPIPPTLLLERPPLVFSRVDPSSGPRLVRGERRALLGRQDPLEAPEPWEVGDAVLPDLENDDMFARRTQAFYPNSDLALMKTSVHMSQSCFPEQEVSIVAQPFRHGDSRRPCLPDIQRDDVVYRKVNPQQAQRPLSGDPERYTPLQIPEPWALPPSLQAQLLCPPCPLTQEVPSEDQNEKEERPKTDDMSLRKFGVRAQGQGSHPAKSVNQMTPSVPTSCSEGDLQKMQEIREASRLRFRKKQLVERLVFLKS